MSSPRSSSSSSFNMMTQTMAPVIVLLCISSLHLQLVRPVSADGSSNLHLQHHASSSIIPENRTSKLVSTATWIPVRSSIDRRQSATLMPRLVTNLTAMPTDRRQDAGFKMVGKSLASLISSPSNSSSNNNAITAGNNTKSYASLTADSLLRPSFLTNLFRTRTSSTLQQQAQSDADGDQETSSSIDGDQASSSSSSGNNADDEEEVTQTIVVPVNESGEPTNGESIESGDTDGSESGKPSESLSSYGLDAAKLIKQHQQGQQQRQKLLTAAAMMSMLQHQNQHHHHQQQQLTQASMSSQLLHSGLQPKPEASLQLSKTEISSLLNDREAPEFYRERELNGDGVVVGEEPESRLRAAASGDPYSSGPSPMGFNGLDSSGSSFGLDGQHQQPSLNALGGGLETFGQPGANPGSLLHAASDGGAFNHRFGSLGDGDLSGHSASGRLMQSPNEFSGQVSSNGYAGMGSYEGSAGNSLDYNQAGLLRASSGAGDFGAQDEHSGGLGDYAGAAGGGAGFNQMGDYSPNQHQLDRHASELSAGLGGSSEYHPASGGHEFPGGLHGDYSGRLYAAGSHLGLSGGDSGGSFSNGGFSSGAGFNSYPGQRQRLGQSESSAMFSQQSGAFGSSGGGYGSGGSPMSDEQALHENGFVASNRNDMMLRLGSARHKLRPLSPMISMASAKSQEATLLKAESDAEQRNNQQVPGGGGSSSLSVPSAGSGKLATAEVHEALDDEAAAPGDEHDDDEDSGEDQQQQQQEQQQHQEASEDQTNSRLIQAAAFSPRVEFSRAGSAGYLAPKRLAVDASNKIQREQKLHQQQQQHRQQQQQQRAQFAKKSSSSGGSLDNWPPAGAGGIYENPAHAGKYIID